MSKRMRDRVACGMADTSSGARDRQRAGTERSIPSTIGDTLVEQRGDPLRVRNEYWVTLVPTGDPGDHRLWEFSLTTGRLIQTREHLGRIL